MLSTLDDLLRPEVQEFILGHEEDDERMIVLKHRDICGMPASIIADQISARKKAKDKLPLYYHSKGIIFPPSVNMEQSSSETAAELKSQFVAAAMDHENAARGADLTGGFGVDSFYLSKLCKAFDYGEPNEPLLEISRNNHRVLGAVNIAYHVETAEHFLKHNALTFDFIFLDPSRRRDGVRTVKLSNYDPDVASLMPLLFQNTKLVVIKTSPLLDLQQGISDIKSVWKIIVVAIRNECKEILFFCRKGHTAETIIECVNFTAAKELQTLDFSFSNEQNSKSRFSGPLTYLYEPNAAILKAGAFKTIGARFELAKLHQHTHLYTSDKLIGNFPGRIFKIEKINPDASDFRKLLGDDKANVVTRNYPLSAETLQKKLKLGNGGEKFVIGFTGVDRRFVVIASRIAPTEIKT